MRLKDFCKKHKLNYDVTILKLKINGKIGSYQNGLETKDRNLLKQDITIRPYGLIVVDEDKLKKILQ